MPHKYQTGDKIKEYGSDTVVVVVSAATWAFTTPAQHPNPNGKCYLVRSEKWPIDYWIGEANLEEAQGG